MRWLYLCLVRMHPRSFRLRFEEDLPLTLDDMSQRNKGYRILWDLAASLARQWILRPHDWLQEPVSPLRNEDMFCRFVVERRPHPMSLLLGGVISIALFFGIAAAASGVQIAGSPNSFTSALAKSLWGLWPRKDFVPTQSPAEERLAAWLDAYNSGQQTVMERFLATEVDIRSPKLPSRIELLREWSGNYKEFGPYRLRKVENSAPNLYRAIGMAQVNDGTWWEILVAVSTEKPNKVIEIRVDRLGPGIDERNKRKQ